MRSTAAKIWTHNCRAGALIRVMRPPERFGQPVFCDPRAFANKSGFCRRHLVLYNVGSPGQSSTGWLVKPATATPFFCLLRIYNYSCIHICSLNCHYKQLKPARVIFVHGTSILPERQCIYFSPVVPLGRRHNINHRFIASLFPEAFVSSITESSFQWWDPVGGAHLWHGVCSPFFLVDLLKILKVFFQRLLYVTSRNLHRHRMFSVKLWWQVAAVPFRSHVRGQTDTNLLR